MAGVREIFEIVDKATSPLRKIAQEMQNTASGAKGLRKAALQAVAGFATFQTVKAAVQLSDQLTQVQARINGITGDIAFDSENGDAQRNIAFIKKVHKDYGTWEFVTVQSVG